jgi:hypothetical protein
MTSTLKESATEYFESFNLTSKQLNQMESLVREHQWQNSRRSKPKRLLIPFASLVAGIFLVIFFQPAAKNELNPNGIANEIAYNHNKTLSLEFKGNSIPEIRSHFSKLDFNLVSSKNNELSKLKLIGGRYCSINKQLAAQLELIGANGHDTLTWYQVPLPANQKGFPGVKVVYSNGVKVIMWTEKGILHGLAGKQ